MSIHQLDIYGRTLLEVSIERLKAFEPKEGYYLAFSGGKDSVAIKALADMAGVKYDAHYNLTSVDPPELVQFVKSFDDVIIDKPRYPDDYRNESLRGKQVTMWNLIPEKRMPPTMLVRYCCAELKESGGDGRLTITGVRWAESVNRKKNQGVLTVYGNRSPDIRTLREMPEFRETPRGGVILNNDNHVNREWMERCYQRNKTVINPIIDWTDEEVWEFIREFNIPYCKLYDQGYKRLGCIGCPMGGGKRMESELTKYPKYKQAYLKAFGRMLEEYKDRSRVTSWGTAEDVYKWWIRNE